MGTKDRGVQRQRTGDPVAEVEQMHALVDQLPAARAGRHGAPLAVIAEAPAMAVAAANVQELAVNARVNLGRRPLQAGMEAMVEAHLHAPARALLGLDQVLDLSNTQTGRLLHEDV